MRHGGRPDCLFVPAGGPWAQRRCARIQRRRLEEHPMGSRTRFAVAMGLLQCVAICPGLPASAQAPDKADATAARKEGNLSWYTSTPVALAQQLADKFQEQSGIKVQLLRYRRPGGVAAEFSRRVSAGRPGADVGSVPCPMAAPPTAWPSRACSSHSSRRASTRWWMTPVIWRRPLDRSTAVRSGRHPFAQRYQG